MPPRNHRHNRSFITIPGGAATLLLAISLPAGAGVAPPPSDSFAKVRDREIELHYRLEGAASRAEIELWYTRDRGTNWQRDE